jgi:hypothetical protein
MKEAVEYLGWLGGPKRAPGDGRRGKAYAGIAKYIYSGLARNPNYKAVDVLANYKSGFEERSKLPAIERAIAQKGVVLYDRTMRREIS